MDKIFPEARVKLEISGKFQTQNSSIEFLFSEDEKGVFSPGKQVGTVLPVTEETRIRYLVSLGKREKIDNQIYFKAAAAFARWCNDHSVAAVSLDTQQPSINGDFQITRSVLEGLSIGGFEFDRYKTKKSKLNQPVKICILSPDTVTFAAEVNRAGIFGEALDLARDWIHEPANIINPQTLEDRAVFAAKKFGLTCKVIQYAELVKMGAGGIAAVGRGSQVKPRLIIIEYKGAGSASPIVLVGKAITFDTGGYSLKGADFIKGMKYDKAGGISVLATILAAARLKLTANIVAVIPTAENMISGDAYRPDDILTLLSGLTVEITTTDAEGRLILADALTYAQTTFKPSAMIDIATLTGGVKIALGSVRAGLLANSDKLADLLFKLGEKNGEKVWRLPMDEDYFDLIKGDDADMKNAGAREASTIVGGIFLKQVIDDRIPWAHLDIAATGESEDDTAWCSKGPTGFGIRLMLDALEELSK
ncbi:MAG: leucyl aminopeptidase family protein [Leptolinea sp.]